MKAFKCLLGFICLLLAILIGTALLLLVCAGGFKCPEDLPLTVSAIWLGGTGMFLIIWRNVPLSNDGRIRFFTSSCFCAAFFIFVAAPYYIRSRATCCANPCINNLRQIDAAANQFALEHNLTSGASINFPDDLTPYIKLNSAGKIPSCPEGGIYHISKVGENPTCTLGNMVTPGHYLP